MMTNDEVRELHPFAALYEECGCCGHLHPLGYGGDCRDDSQRFKHDEIDARHADGWPIAVLSEDRESILFRLTVWDEHDIKTAGAEGWGIFITPENETEIQRKDENPVFPDDAAALAHVKARALAGSMFHTRALAALYDGNNHPIEEWDY